MQPIKGFFFRDFKQTYMPEILKEIYRDQVYESKLAGKKDLVMADFGTNIGLWTFYAYDKASKIYSLEPAKEHFECFVTMLANNDMMDKVVPIQKAISNENGKAKFFHNANTTMYSLNEAVSQGEFEEVETITFDKFFKENKIKYLDFLKVDIEGAEAQLFGDDGFDKVKDKIDIIMGEFHAWTNINPKQFENYFRDRGFTFEWVNKTEATLFLAERIK